MIHKQIHDEEEITPEYSKIFQSNVDSNCNILNNDDNKENYNKIINETNYKNDVKNITLRQRIRLFSFRALFVIFIWYLFSFVAIFLSKYLIDYKSVDLFFFSFIQLLISTILAWLHLECSKYKQESNTSKDLWVTIRDFYQSLSIIGAMRLLLIYCGLLSMKYVALSFMETVKSSAPLFTVIISYIILKEHYSLAVHCSLLPIMLGLMLCCAHEISFNWIGFSAALAANVAECIQFVLSKIFLNSNVQRMNPNEFQFYTSLAALLINLPIVLFLSINNLIIRSSWIVFAFMVVTGLCYYFQTMMAWILMEFLSPVTHSIFNTVKCGLAVWLSVLLFSNHVTLLSGFGSCIVISGVFAYQKARSIERLAHKELESVLIPE